MNKVIKIIVYLIIITCIFAAGFYFGKGSLKEKLSLNIKQAVNPDSSTQDLLIVANKYGNVVSLCEEKYQTALSGDKTSGDKLNEQINQLISQINQLLEKYSPSVNTESY